MRDIAVVCSTYRNPEKDNTVREYGIMKLVDQIFNQDYKGGKVTLIIVDDSAEPHPFLNKIKDNLGDRFMYLHVPSRNNISDEYRKKYPRACEFIPNDKAMNSNHWKVEKLKVAAWENFLPFDYEFAKQYKIDMVGQMMGERPTIGMKKNFGCMAYCEATGSQPSIFTFVDDDDLRSPDYLSTVEKHLGDEGFARMTKTYAYNYSNNEADRIWGEIDFQLTEDVNGKWFIPNDVMDSDCFKVDDGQIITRPVHDLYQRNLQLAWPVIGHDGALHNYAGNTWLFAAENFGGFFPTSFSEDIITHHMMEKHGVTTSTIPVDEPRFIRCADGRNASDFYATKLLEEDGISPWAKESIAGFYDFLEKSKLTSKDAFMKAQASQFLNQGTLDHTIEYYQKHDVQVDTKPKANAPKGPKNG